MICDFWLGGLRKSTARFLALATWVSILASSEATGQTSQRKYRPNELKLLGSDTPIPKAHVRCMGFKDQEFLKWREVWKKYTPRTPLEDAVKQNVLTNIRQSIQVDWGVPPTSVAAKMLDDANGRLKENEGQLIQAKRDLQGAVNKKEGGVLLHLKKFQVIIGEWGLAGTHSTMSYARCVVENGLPPTIKE